MLEFLDAPDSYMKIVKLTSAISQRLGQLEAEADGWQARYEQLKIVGPEQVGSLLEQIQASLKDKEYHTCYKLAYLSMNHGVGRG